MVIHEEQAWVIARAFAEDVANLLGQRLLAVYVIGSLACGSYRPGRSDIDTLLTVPTARQPMKMPLMPCGKTSKKCTECPRTSEEL